MKINKSVQVITMFSKGEPMAPLHFRISLDEDFCDPLVENKVLTVTRESFIRNEGILYNCLTSSGNEIFFYNLKFEQSSHKWKLWRM